MDAVQHFERSPTAYDPHTGNDPQIGPQMIPDVKSRNGMEFGSIRFFCSYYDDDDYFQGVTVILCNTLKKEGRSFRNIGNNISLYYVIRLANFRLLFNLLLTRSSTARGSGTSILSRCSLQKLTSKEIPIHYLWEICAENRETENHYVSRFPVRF